MNAGTLATRTISGLVYIGIITGCIFWGREPFTWMSALFGAVATIEFEKITHETRAATVPALLLDIAGVACLAFAWMVYPLIVWIAVMVMRMTLQLYLKSDTPIADLSKSLMAQVYIGMPLGAMAALGAWWNLHIVLAVFIMIWLNDTGAFLVGSAVGRHRLFERISPKKSWEGFFGGLAFNIGAAFLFRYGMEGFWHWTQPVGVWIGLGCLVTVFSTWGDLVESMIKRSLHIKDSGNLIPGHGGILDRIDSLLFVMPATLVYILLVEELL